MRISATLPGFVLLAVAASGGAQVPPMQPEFQVSQGTLYSQYAYGIAIDRAGRFVVTWSGYDGSSSSYDCLGRLYEKDGAPQTGEFQINPSTADQYDGDVAKDASGRFIVVWQEADDLLMARRFLSSGAPAGAAFPVNTVAVPVSDMHVASDDSGNVLVAWTREDPSSSFNVAARRFDSSDAPISGEFLVNSYTTSEQRVRGVGLSPSGFAVAWTGWGTGSASGIWARRFDSSGVPITGDLHVNQAAPPSPIVEADLVMSASGAFVVAWEGTPNPGIIAPYLRRYDTAGAPLGGEFVANATYTSGLQVAPRLAGDHAGNFLVTWDGPSVDADQNGIAARLFDRFGNPVSEDFRVNTTTAGNQYGSHAAINDSGTFVVTWASPDSSYYGVVARRSGAQAAAMITVDPGALRGSESSSGVGGNGVLEPGESALVATAWANQGESSLALTGIASSFTGPAGANYTLDDAIADYGVVAAGGTGSCLGTADCYAVTVSAPPARPAQHWDTELQEALSAGLPKTWALHVGGSFPDVDTGNIFYAFIETLFHDGVTGGCAGGGYCPTNPVTRAQMAVFLLKSRFGSAHLPPPCTGAVFTDVPCTGGAFDPWIEELASLQITGGCGGGLYCPGNPVTRQQMAVFLLKTLEGSGYVPPTCSGVFDDVTCPSQFADWIEELATRSITGGCSVSPPLYCPTNPNNRGQMAVFLVKTFGLVLYGG